MILSRRHCEKTVLLYIQSDIAAIKNREKNIFKISAISTKF